MDGVGLRILLLLNVVVPLVLFMAWIYLGLHIVFGRIVRGPESPVLWFFGVLTAPLTRPVRAFLPAGTPDTRVRSIAFAFYMVLWLVARVVLGSLTGAVTG
jgi:hypothetical protein